MQGTRSVKKHAMSFWTGRRYRRQRTQQITLPQQPRGPRPCCGGLIEGFGWIECFGRSVACLRRSAECFGGLCRPRPWHRCRSFSFEREAEPRHRHVEKELAVAHGAGVLSEAHAFVRAL